MNSSANMTAVVQDGDHDHEEIIEAKYEQKYESVEGSDMEEEMTDISELQVQLQ